MDLGTAIFDAILGFDKQAGTIRVPTWALEGLRAYLDAGGALDLPLLEAIATANLVEQL